MTDAISSELAGLDLGDVRLDRRIRSVLCRLYESPSTSPSGAMQGWAEMMGAYRLLGDERCTSEAIFRSHREAVLERVRRHPRVLLVQDTTELDYSTKTQQAGRGPLSVEKRQGYFAHTQWAITPERLPLGTWHCQIRARAPEVGVSAEHKHKPIGEKESVRWLEGYQQACSLKEAAPGVEVTSCADREGDVYEVFVEWQRRKEQGLACAEWLIRCNQNRGLLPPAGGGLPELVPGLPARVVEQVAASEALGCVCFEIRTKEQIRRDHGNKSLQLRQGRQVRQEIRSQRVRLRPPQRPGQPAPPPVDIWVVLSKEIAPPAGQEPVDWILLTSRPADGLSKALEVLELYEARWDIEVFHRVLKTGCKVEELQFKDSHQVRALVALYMIVAWRLLYLTRLGRECPDLPCDVVFAEEEWKSICRITRGPGGTLAKPSLQEMIGMLAHFGGHPGRKSDGPPGAEVMWRGLQCLRCFAMAWRAFGQDTS